MDSLFIVCLFVLSIMVVLKRFVYFVHILEILELLALCPNTLPLILMMRVRLVNIRFFMLN